MATRGANGLRRFRTPGGRAVVHLPHLSQFKLFSRPACLAPLRRVFRIGSGASGAPDL